jgi:hypothetical protein
MNIPVLIIGAMHAAAKVATKNILLFDDIIKKTRNEARERCFYSTDKKSYYRVIYK